MPGAGSARQIAARQITAHAERFPDLLPVPLATDHLEPRDAALAHAIEDAVIRRWLTLEYLLNLVLRQPLATSPAPVRGVLLSGAAQLLLLDRIPVHAAIHETVELGKEMAGRGAGGLVNAVLRKVAGMRAEADDTAPWEGRRDRLPLSDGRTLRLQNALLPSSDLERYAVATSHARWLLERWKSAFGDRARLLAEHSLVAPPTILNTAHASRLQPASIVPHEEAGHHVFTGSRAELIALLASRHDLWVQDPSSSLAVAGASHLMPRLIIDSCAGQGTKTRQLAATFPGARIIATDIDAARYRVLEQTYRARPELGVEVIPRSELFPQFGGKADLVLLDVPCSNTGVLARRPEAKYRAGDAQLQRLGQIQRRIIADSIPLLASGGEAGRGRILYSTCSIDREENDDVVAWAVQQHHLKVKHQRLTLPGGLPGEPAALYRDGSFSALLG